MTAGIRRHVLQTFIKLLNQLHIRLIFKVSYCHIRLTHAAHIIRLKNKVVIADSPSDKCNVIHKVFGESVLCTAECLFLVRFFHRSGRIIPAVYYYDAVETLHKQRDQSCVQLWKHLIAAILSLFLRQRRGSRLPV